ncbi:laminin subunit alpha-like [Argopecten irradians]|uniref:laminin subunit alpha-like n=1 Tax=Argopecten irradians TaxID=31199 RepID=UPI00372218DB
MRTVDMTAPSFGLDNRINTCREPTVKDTLQSSTYATGTESSKAVDGCITQRYSSGCCMHTATDGRSSAYWAVDFNENIVIESIKIYYRDEPNTNQQKSRFGGYEIYISNSTSILSPCYEDTVSTISAVDLAPSITSCTGSARYLGVYVERSSRAYNWYSFSAVLEICEVEVYDCADGTFKSGTICDSCSSNCIGSTCDINTGECSACIDGFHGSTCDQLCSIGCSTGTCNQATGQCDGACSSGYYGAGCDSACSDNCLNGECEQYTGTCGACYDGYYGDTCSLSCSVKCATLACSQNGGKCSACSAGYYGIQCDTACPSNCLAKTCNQDDGLCLGRKTTSKNVLRASSNIAAIPRVEKGAKMALKNYVLFSED